MANPELSRRRFLQVSVVATGGLLAACSSSSMLSSKADQTQPDPHAWLHIDRSGVITYQVPSVEMGQGVQTSLSMIVAEELDANWESIRTEFATNHSQFNNPLLFAQMTAASRSVWGFWKPMRILGASVRQMLIEAAAHQWRIPADQLRSDKGYVIHPNGQKLGYGELVDRAAKLEPPRKARLKDPSEFKLIGQALPRLDIPEKVAGQAEYGIDVDIPGAKIASLILCPVVEGDVLSFNGEAALKLEGVEQVIQIPKNLSSESQAAGVAVVADSYFTAQKALKLIQIEWDEGQYKTLDSAGIRHDMARDLEAMPKIKAKTSSQSLDVVYQTPFLTQAPLEPMNATARVSSTQCEIWAPTQNTSAAVVCAKSITGLDKEAIHVHTPYLGGGFGRRLEIDYIAYAVYVAKQSQQTVKLIWSREEDIKHGYYRPASMARFQIALDQSGYPSIWHSMMTAPHYFGRFQSLTMPATRFFPIDRLSRSTVASGMTDSPIATGPFLYQADDFDMDVKLAKLPIPTGNHRAVMHSYTGFYSESVVDEAAHLAGIDPYQYRRQLILKAQQDPSWVAKRKGLDHRRLLNVLDLVAQKANWGNCPAGHHQGIALSFSNKTFVAQVAEISVSQDKKVTVHNVVAALDCGIAINPDTIRAQFEGGIFWALSGTFEEEITFAKGRVEQNNFYDYRTLYTRHMPDVDVHIVPSAEPPSGVGEPAIPALIPAVCNAIFSATGERIRRLPIKHSGFSI